ncbi:MAG: galactose/glucose ABC transporter substrate-binding protein MglB [Bacillota bacterium]
MKKILAITLILVLSLSVVACGQDGDTSDGGGENASELPKIGVTIYKFDDNFMSFVRRSIETRAEGKAELILNDSQNSQAKQNEQVDMMLSKGVGALAINLVDPQAASSIVDKAKNEDIPVVFFNKEPKLETLKSYEDSVYVGTKSEESGIMQGKIVADAWKDNPEWDKNGDGVMQYVLLKGEPGHPDAEARTKYVIESAKEKGVEVEELELQTGMWDSVKAKELLDSWLSKHGESIEFVIANNDAMALGAISALEQNGYFKDDKFMPVVGVDAIPDALSELEEGTLVGTVLNDAKGQGAATLDAAINAANGKDFTAGTEYEIKDKSIRVPYVPITQDNIDVARSAYE